MVRLNITLPEDIVGELERIDNKSRYIAQLLRERFQQEKKQKLRELLAEGYQKSAQIDAKTNSEWESATIEGEWE